jgi:hypothetical protein
MLHFVQQFPIGFCQYPLSLPRETVVTDSASKEIQTGVTGLRRGNEAAIMNSLIHTLFSASFLFAGIITLGVGVLLFCCVGCTRCPGKEEDDLFRHHSA